MSEVPYQNPISPQTVNGPISVRRTDEFGSNFSNLGVGGHMEVYNLSDLTFTIPNGTTGQVNYSGNTIPISLIKGTGASYSPDVLTLYSDNISSGRRKLGMLVYVYETDLTYEFHINNYDVLWSNATGATGVGGNTVVISQFGTQVKSNSVAGVAFISGWTGSTIEGVGGITRENANWRVFNRTGIYLTGGTYYSGTSELDLVNNDGSVVTVTGITAGGGGPVNISVSANTGLGIIGDQLFTTYNTLLDTGLTMTSAVGGYASGTTVSQLSGKTFVSLFDDLLFPTQLPTYTIPTIQVLSPSSQNVEVGSAFTTTIQIRGIKNDSGNYTLLGVQRNGITITSTTNLTSASTTNVVNQFGYTNPNSPNSAFTISFIETYTIPTGTTSSTTTYRGIGNYSSGLPKNNNKGVVDSRPFSARTTDNPQLSATSFTSGNITITGLYPYYYGTSSSIPTIPLIQSAITNNIALTGGYITKVVNSISNPLTIDYNTTTGTQFYWLAHNASYPLRLSWLIDSTNKGNINATPDTSGLYTSYSATCQTALWSGKTYYIYITNYDTLISSVIQFNTTTV